MKFLIQYFVAAFLAVAMMAQSVTPSALQLSQLQQAPGQFDVAAAAQASAADPQETDLPADCCDTRNISPNSTEEEKKASSELEFFSSISYFLPLPSSSILVPIEPFHRQISLISDIFRPPRA